LKEGFIRESTGGIINIKVKEYLCYHGEEKKSYLFYFSSRFIFKTTNIFPGTDPILTLPIADIKPRQERLPTGPKQTHTLIRPGPIEQCKNVNKRVEMLG
jgi:hypothetical protein